MNNADWLEIVEWVDQRFTRGWTPDQAVAFYDDLSAHLAEDVWDALYRLYDRGLDFPPNGSQLRKETADVVRGRMERARWDTQGLPEPSNEGLGWEAWREKLGYSGSIDEAIRQRHGELFPKGCPYLGCPECGNVLAVPHPTV